jgi:hypothetical protein
MGMKVSDYLVLTLSKKRDEITMKKVMAPNEEKEEEEAADDKKREVPTTHQALLETIKENTRLIREAKEEIQKLYHSDERA